MNSLPLSHLPHQTGLLRLLHLLCPCKAHAKVDSNAVNTNGNRVKGMMSSTSFSQQVAQQSARPNQEHDNVLVHSSMHLQVRDAFVVATAAAVSSM